MGNIPDFVDQLLQVENALQTQMDATADDWQDEVKDRYYNTFMTDYIEGINDYINGGKNMSGMGLNDLLVFCDEKMQEMDALLSDGYQESF